MAELPPPPPRSFGDDGSDRRDDLYRPFPEDPEDPAYVANLEHDFHALVDHLSETIEYQQGSPNPHISVRLIKLYNLCDLLHSFNLNYIIERLLNLNTYLNQLIINHNLIHQSEIAYENIQQFIEIEDGLIFDINSILEYPLIEPISEEYSDILIIQNIISTSEFHNEKELL